MSKWERRHLELARFLSKWSKDPKKKVGAVVTENNYVRGTGYNGFPRGVEDTKARLADRDIKLQITIHAEINALAAAAGQGDCIYIYPCLPCPQCLGNIIQNGIKRVVTKSYKLQKPTKWQPELVLSLAEEAGLTVAFIDI